MQMCSINCRRMLKIYFFGHLGKNVLLERNVIHILILIIINPPHLGRFIIKCLYLLVKQVLSRQRQLLKCRGFSLCSSYISLSIK